MSGHQATNQQAGQTWTEPPWSGWIDTTGDALLILEAARRGLIPRVTRRLVDSERKMIASGSVFVFDEEESGIKRWTDGFFWSPSRILGNFLLYRETDKRGNRNARTVEPEGDSPDAFRPAEGSLSRPKTDAATMGIDRHRERLLCGSLTNSYKFKSDGLMKKTFSLTINGVAQHLISYYKIEDVENGRLRTPSSLPELASLEISPEYLDKTHFRNAPKVETGADGIPRYRGEGDEMESPSSPSSSIVPNPLESNLPLLTDAHVAEGSSSSGKRQKRFLPYASSRPRRRHSTHSDDPSISSSPPTPLSASEASGPSAQSSQGLQPPHAAAMSPVYPTDPNMQVPTPGTFPQYSYFATPPPINYQHPPPPLPGPQQAMPANSAPPIQQQQQQQHVPIPPQPYQYPYYPPPPPHAPPPHVGYPTYAGPPWPYSSYPVQPQP
ncbi:hypothetical protein FA15DRAFT_621866, partial [Coprinopsis marcescibilis]